LPGDDRRLRLRSVPTLAAKPRATREEPVVVFDAHELFADF